MIRVGILGAAGYTGGELIRLLLSHPEAEIVFANSESNAGNLVSDVHEGLIGDTDLRFTDQTLVCIVGRVVGGNTEGYKPLGMGASVANIGQAKIVLDGGYGLNVIEEVNGTEVTTRANTEQRTMPQGSTQVNSTAYIVGASNIDDTNLVEIYTDPETGEFAAMLPPLNYSVRKITIPGNPDIDFGNVSTMLDARAADQVITDSLLDAEAFSYVARLRKIYHTDPVVSVTDQYNQHGDEGVFGVDAAYYTDRYGKQTDKMVKTYDFDESTGTVHYLYDYPILDPYVQDENEYEIRVYEPYVNKDDPTNLVYYREPSQYVLVHIVNEFSSEQSVVAEGDERGARAGQLVTTDLVTDSVGVAKYRFYTGYPNVNDDHTLGMTMTFDMGDVVYDWDQNDKFRVIVLGSLARGNGFTTKGPDKVDYVLRDPPGTASSATIQKGSTTTTTTTWNDTFSGGVDGSVGIKKKMGGAQRVEGGIFLGMAEGFASQYSIQGEFVDPQQIVTEPGATSSLTPSFKLTGSGTWGGTSVESTTLNESFSTDASANYVGANGDVYFGKTSNVTLGEATYVGLYEGEAGQVKLDVREEDEVSLQYETMFIYTQQHIENIVIPEQERNVRELLTAQPPLDSLDFVKLPTSDPQLTTPRYYTWLTPDDPRFGTLNSDSTVWGDRAVPDAEYEHAPSYKMVIPGRTQYDDDGDAITDYVDMVAFYISSVANWKERIADNERDKWQAINGGSPVQQNVSFSSGTSYTNSVTEKNTNSDTAGGGFSLNLAIARDKNISSRKNRYSLALRGSVSLSEAFNTSTTEAHDLFAEGDRPLRGPHRRCL